MEYKSKIRDDVIDELFKGIMKLESLEECYRFFEDICTVKELLSISQRFQVAKLLRQEKTYNKIEEVTGASTATISRINRCLNYGADGYDIVLNKLSIDESSKKE